jgi:SAM-dependent methyltransferase
MRSEEYKEAFSLIAPYYDTLMSFVDYPAWIAYIERICAFYDVHEKSILDLACGTGVCLEMWHEKNYTLIGIDKSRAMIDICRKRFAGTENNIILINADMCRFNLATKVAVVTCLYDSLNYILSEDDLLDCFKCVHDVLDRNGIFVFDMNTLHCLRDEWGNSTFHRQDAGISSIWSNVFDHAHNISTLQISITVQNNGQVLTFKERHQERGYPLTRIAELLTKARLDFSFYRHLTFNPAHEQNMRIMGVARKC